MIDDSATPPAWVYKRDGRLVPFDSDKISRALFAATESLGRPDPFLARELTDGVLHFLAAEAERTPLATAQVAEMVTKVVRELGQPALAQAFTNHARQRPPRGQRPSEHPSGISLALPEGIADPQARAWQTSRLCWCQFSLREVFGRDLVAAQEQGLLLLGGLETPLEPAAAVLGPLPSGGLFEHIHQARKWAGGLLAVDGPEYELLSRRDRLSAEAYARELRLALAATGLRAVLNLNVSTPPTWATELAAGPLFPDRPAMPPPHQVANLMAQLWDELHTGEGGDQLRFDWHLSERDFTEPPSPLLTTLARQALEGSAVAFTFDRPRRPIALAEGLDRSHPALLMVVGVGLLQLAEQLGGQPAPERFLAKLPSLAHLALSAGVQKRDFLRRCRTDWPGFLLGQARLIVVPLGLEAVVQRLLGRGSATGGPSAELARRIVQTLAEALHRAGAAYRLDTAVDSPPDGQFELATGQRPARQPDQPAFTCGDGSLTPRVQLKAAGQLHAAAGAGTAHVQLSPDGLASTDELIRLLEYAWQQTAVSRLRFLGTAPTTRQLPAPWEDLPAS